MTSKKYLGIIIALLVVTSAAHARDQIQHFPIADVMQNEEYAGRLEGVQFFFGDQTHPEIAQNYGEFQSNKKTNAFNKSDKGACEWAFLSALLSFHDRALSSGGNAVVGITGYYKKNKYSSETEFQCGAGNIMAGVTLKGKVVKLK
ncbi:MAG: hypothetical protein OEQ39_01520 [Gammaproteobacteria bacterium]|nr:hypothetical protein [Gammaproteobacteria bacterium]MDH3467849.1 hypothetical protein [Gammaproteobacteria bacterium]